jgi:hypothetical protein
MRQLIYAAQIVTNDGVRHLFITHGILNEIDGNIAYVFWGPSNKREAINLSLLPNEWLAIGNSPESAIKSLMGLIEKNIINHTDQLTRYNELKDLVNKHIEKINLSSYE